MLAKIFKFLSLSVLFLGFFPSLGWALRPSDSGVNRTLKIWDREIEYQLLIKKDRGLSHDGEAFTKKVKGQKISYVVLNPAFFEKEAEALFERFRREKNPSANLKSLNSQELARLEEKLLSFQGGIISLSSLAPSSKESLKKLKTLFEEIAWRTLYKASLAKSGVLQEAKEIFIKDFTTSRLRTIEHHEAAHLYDILGSAETKSPEFEKFTEVNAFYAELVHGENPHDSMAQAVSGLIDEMNRGKVVDYSVEKVLSVARFLKDCPQFAKRFKPSPLTPCCLEMLAKIKRKDFIRIGTELFRENQDRFPSQYALLTK